MSENINTIWQSAEHELLDRRDQCDDLIKALRECVVALEKRDE